MTLLTYQTSNRQMWSQSTYCRPKWGIYRSLNSPSYLRDEDLLFDDFCIAKGGASCPKDLP
jgi:hypothetical protein